MELKKLFFGCVLLLGSGLVMGQKVAKVKITELEKMIAESRTPLIINFWATYCKPCIAEMPHFEKLGAKYKEKGLTVVFVSLDMEDDYPVKVDSFVAKRKLQNKVLWLDETNADYFCPKIDPKWSGAMPATLFVNNTKSYRRLLEEELTEEELEKEIMAIL
ncbi:MAG: TlpA family protein disulfide reductase [Chitinophagaceae bacterium]|jgi:thiol-disulfide isomerase/thioredoxin|nr:MAG: TlpA family protein disulfide reductase [Chitinophagaceae bacterium]